MIRALAAVLLLLSPVHAQLPGIGAKKTPPAASPAETPEQIRERFQQQLKAARENFAKLDDAVSAGRLPEGISANELADRRRDAQQTVVALERHLKMLAARPQAADLAKKAAEALADWKGFKEKPPYSVLQVDDLRAQRETAAEKQSTARSTQQLHERTLDDIRNEAKVADDALRSAASADLKAPDAAWRLEAANDRVAMIAARKGAQEAALAVQREVVAEAESRLGLLDRKLKETESKQALREEDLKQVRDTAQARETALRKELKALQERYDAAVKARSKLDYEAAAPEATDLTRLRHEIAQTRADTLAASVESLTILAQIEGQTVESFEQRRVLLNSKDGNAREDAIEALKKRAERLAALGVFATNSIAVANAELRGQEARAASLPAGDPQLAPLNELRTDLWERLNVTQRLAQAVDLQKNQLGHWLGDFDRLQSERTVGQRFKDGLKSAWRRVVNVWNFSIWKYEGPDGRKGAINLGTLVRAFLLFTFGYWLAARITRKLQRYAVSHRRVAEAQAATLRTWMMVLLSFLLAIATLHVLSIPLTLFAFLGGALAIGLGFGTQTLIKNFISGIIVLFERNIRVGDILDVGGTVGTVVEINTRSSVVRGGDGVETLIPNSVFLENKITNWTHNNRRVRRTVRVGVEYGSPLQTTADILVDCAKRHGLVLKDPEPVAQLEDFGPSALQFALNFWIELAEKSNAAQVASDLRFMIHKRFTEAGIVIPAPAKETKLVIDAPLKMSTDPGAWNTDPEFPEVERKIEDRK
jgi:potassium efflux system protein